jgi:integrase
MSTSRLNFSKKVLADLAAPATGRAYHYDAKTRGLVFAITPTGSRSFQVYRSVKGRPERITLGKFPDLTVEQARVMAAEVNSAIAQGKNPKRLKAPARTTLDKLLEAREGGQRFDPEQEQAIFARTTLTALGAAYVERHAKVHKKSWRKDEAMQEHHLKTLKFRQLANIEKSDVEALHAKVGRDSGRYAANRLLALLSKMFSVAQGWGWKGDNPAKGIKKFKEESRERFLEGDEMPRFFKALAEEPNTIARDFFLTSLLTGARKTNVLMMRWAEIDLDKARWRIPETKSGESHTLPLPQAIVEVLKAREASTESEYVFPGRGKTGHMVEPKSAWRRILDRAQIDDLRIHDLRRTLGSWQAATGANLSIIGKTLAHKNVSTTAIYARLNLDPVRDSMEKATSAMLAASEMIQPSRVVYGKK